MSSSPNDPKGEDPPPDLPGSAVPRWLAWIVLVALLSAAAISVHGVLTAPPPAGQTADSVR